MKTNVKTRMKGFLKVNFITKAKVVSDNANGQGKYNQFNYFILYPIMKDMNLVSIFLNS